MDITAISSVSQINVQTDRTRLVEVQKRAAVRDVDIKQVSVTEQTKQAIEDLIRKFGSDKQIRMDFDNSVNRVVITVVDERTQQVIRQIPTADMLAFMRKFTDYLGLLVNKEV
jgi:flagellar protein FlaG